jgi:two-component system cell cycle sensor histidine kinase/response regulator CckA
VSSFEVRPLGPRHIELVHRSARPESRLLCLVRQAQTVMLPTAWGLPPAALLERACLCHGDDACVYDLTWQEPPRLLPALAWTAAGLGLAAAFVAAGYPSLTAWVALPLGGWFAGAAFERRRLHHARLVEISDAENQVRQLSGEEAQARQGRSQAELQTRGLEEQLRQSQKMESIGRLAGGVAHDFNNILSVIMGYSSLLLENLKPGDPHHAEVSEIHQASERATLLTRQLLAFSRRQVLDPRVADLNEVVTGTEQLLRRLLGEDVSLHFKPGAGLAPVRVDVSQMGQVLMNLAVNARDAMPLGGSLTLETANVDLDESYTRSHLEVVPGPYVMLSVTDTGTGMDRETQARIFEPFFTTKGQGKGTGLGLSTAFGIVRQSGGHMAVYSEPGKGSNFKVYLPRAARELPQAEAASKAGRPRGGETVLLAEDEDQVRSLATEVLKREGYQVLEAADGEKALAVAAAHAGPIHLLLTDVVMPRMGGRQLAEELAALRPDLKVLYMSGYTDNTIDPEGNLEQGIAFLQKPFSLKLLAQKVRAVLDIEGQGRNT